MLFKSLVTTLLAGSVSGHSLGRYAHIIDRDTAVSISYDFIIIGGGIGGLTVADRLTENPETTVLVLEDGPFDRGEGSVLIPGEYNPGPYFWPNIFSTPQKGLDNNTFFVPMGNVVGGGSTINAIFLHRCPAVDYNSWENLGNPGWGWDDLLPYFKKSENFTKPVESFALAHNISWEDDVHGFSGPVHASYSPFDFQSSKNFWDASLDTDIAEAKDPNDGDNAGLFWLLRALDPDTETRSYARIAHYDRVSSSRPNYHLLAESRVSKILFKDKTAVGVQFWSKTAGITSTAKVNKEVIVAAGGIHSPQILQVSGIGPASLLQSLGIEVVVDLPGVGSNLQDQMVLTVNYNFSSNIEPNDGTLTTNATYNLEQQTLYNSSRRGAYTLILGTGNNIVTLPLRNTTTSYESIISLAKSQDPASLLPPGTDPSVVKGYKAQRAELYKHLDLLNTVVGSISWNTGFQTSIYMLKPFSRGTVRIASANISDNPLIDFGSLTDPTDLEVSVALLLKNREIMSKAPMQALGPVELNPGANVTSDEDLKAALRATISPTNAHMCCTLPMMGRDLGGVVDSQLRVYGVNGLSVVDVSLWPFMGASAPSATVYAIGEKAADIIKKRYGLPPFN